MFKQFRNKKFMKFHAQGFEQYPFIACKLKKFVIFSKQSDELTSARYQVRPIKYRVKYSIEFKMDDDDEPLMLKARIGPQGNEDSLRLPFSPDCC